MSTQPKALELAQAIDEGVRNGIYKIGAPADYAASILRLQHEVIGELVGALDSLTAKWRDIPAKFRDAYTSEHQARMDLACAALARAKELEGEK